MIMKFNCTHFIVTFPWSETVHSQQNAYIEAGSVSG